MTTAVQDKGTAIVTGASRGIGAAIVSWLVSPQASFVTGSDITVSGGL